MLRCECTRRLPNRQLLWLRRRRGCFSPATTMSWLVARDIPIRIAWLWNVIAAFHWCAWVAWACLQGLLRILERYCQWSSDWRWGHRSLILHILCLCHGHAGCCSRTVCTSVLLTRILLLCSCCSLILAGCRTLRCLWLFDLQLILAATLAILILGCLWCWCDSHSLFDFLSVVRVKGTHFGSSSYLDFLVFSFPLRDC